MVPLTSSRVILLSFILFRPCPIFTSFEFIKLASSATITSQVFCTVKHFIMLFVIGVPARGRGFEGRLTDLRTFYSSIWSLLNNFYTKACKQIWTQSEIFVYSGKKLSCPYSVSFVTEENLSTDMNYYNHWGNKSLV